MSDMREQSLAALRWLIEAGADEAIAEEPVNRFRVPPPAPATAEAVRRNPAPLPIPEAPPRIRPGQPFLPQPQSATKTTSAGAVSLSTVPGAARALAAGCATL